jgi:holo-[acyl-carrier protein] synthase
MEIVGIGAEIVECERIARMIEEHGELFLERVFTPREMRRCRESKDTTERFAELWAAKEAVLKSLGIASVKNLTWTDLEICSDAAEGILVRLQGAIKERAEKQKVSVIHLSMAHCRTHATAHALATRD